MILNIRDAFAGCPEIETQRLRLRKLRHSDAAELLALYSDPEVMRFLDWQGVTAFEEAELLIAIFEQQQHRGKSLRWAMADRQDDKLLGTLVVTDISSSKLCSIGYDLLPGMWGKGLMSEALGALLSFLFEQLGFERIQAYVHPQNHASCRLLEKLGFEREALLRRGAHHSGRDDLFDVLLYAKLR